VLPSVAVVGDVAVIQTNTYQAVLTTDGSLSFVMFHYGNLTWTAGILSGGDPETGLGGNSAAVSYNCRDS